MLFACCCWDVPWQCRKWAVVCHRARNRLVYLAADLGMKHLQSWFSGYGAAQLPPNLHVMRYSRGGWVVVPFRCCVNACFGKAECWRVIVCKHSAVDAQTVVFCGLTYSGGGSVRNDYFQRVEARGEVARLLTLPQDSL